MITTIEKTLNETITQSVDLTEDNFDKNNLVSDIVTMAINNIHGSINERNWKLSAYNHNVTLQALEIWLVEKDLDRYRFNHFQIETLKKHHPNNWRNKIKKVSEIYVEVAEIYHISPVVLVQLYLDKQQRNQESHFNYGMGSFGDDLFTQHFSGVTEQIPSSKKRTEEKKFFDTYLTYIRCGRLIDYEKRKELCKMFKHCCEKNMSPNKRLHPPVPW
ncbi:unnamed protein product [Adineta steineri]|uniref:Uncharacterized protein n=1 Tax=Adineta steineri TaxID=433720 RepID=A0A819FV19_9BILA|nr:unnamed protein product [Adineta steineri]CAF3874893.1 unnamed protein product [Adineta steineri]